MIQDQIHSELKQKYNYDRYKPDFESSNLKYKVFRATQKELNLNVSIKLSLGLYDSQIISYLQKIKSVKSEYVIKIYQIISQPNYIVMVTEQVNYGTLASGLAICKKLDDLDSIYLQKYLLNGHVDLLRSNMQWYGNSNDIDITQNGIKLSWNNSIQITETGNCVKKVMEQISSDKIQQNQQRLLPFPENKQILQLIKLSETSASEISLNSQMKKKQKYMKKKFKQYLIVKQTKSIPEYFEQTVWLGVSKEHGFVKIKSYLKGTIRESLLELNKTKTTFTKVIETVEQGNKIYVISGYSNGGLLQNYVQKLKSAGILLKQDQIQFFFYSLFQPLKLIQESSLKSLNMSLHVRNIYIENGIPKIGEPLPLNSQTIQKLIQKADVPDFYHPDFKKNPKINNASFDTYSLGVLLYKLMYTEYPIFPNGKVHIPTTPTYNSRLKKTLEIFLNQGGELSEIQKRIEVSENVLKQVKKNKQKLINDKKEAEQKNKKSLAKSRYVEVEEVDNLGQVKEQKETNNENLDEQEITDDCFDCCVNIDLADTNVEPEVQSLEQSPYKIYRQITKVLAMLLIYILVLYLYYLQHNFKIISDFAYISPTNITISTIKYEIITADISQFYLQFNQTSKGYSDLQSIGCFVNYNNSLNRLVYPNSPQWLAFISGGLGVLILILGLKSWLVFKFDYIKVKFNYQHGQSNYNYSNFWILNLMLMAFIHHHFCLFNQIFYSSLPSCLGNYKTRTFSHTYYMFNSNTEFMKMHLPVFIGHLILLLLHFYMVLRTQKVKYSKLFNPIFIFLPFLLLYWVAVRIGALSSYFYPSFIWDENQIIKSYFKQLDYIGILGIIPEILFGIEMIVNKLIDLCYWMLIDKKRRIMIINQSSTQNIRLNSI